MKGCNIFTHHYFLTNNSGDTHLKKQKKKCKSSTVNTKKNVGWGSEASLFSVKLALFHHYQVIHTTTTITQSLLTPHSNYHSLTLHHHHHVTNTTATISTITPPRLSSTSGGHSSAAIHHFVTYFATIVWQAETDEGKRDTGGREGQMGAKVGPKKGRAGRRRNDGSEGRKAREKMETYR